MLAAVAVGARAGHRGPIRPIGRVATASRPVLSTWMFVAVVQGGIGYLQYFTGVPEMLVGAHIAGATALWVVTVWLALGSRCAATLHAGRTGHGYPAAIARSMEIAAPTWA